jgi:hypothetical protein
MRSILVEVGCFISIQLCLHTIQNRTQLAKDNLVFKNKLSLSKKHLKRSKNMRYCSSVTIGVAPHERTEHNHIEQDLA